MLPYLCLVLCWLALPLQGLEILDPEEVEYIRSHTTATVGGSVTLDCGSVMPTIFIWGYTKPGTDNNRAVAVAYNYGQGPKLQSQSSSMGRLWVPEDTTALVIEDVQQDAAGMYTCQALYDTDEGARITFYLTRLDVEDH
ncbi:Ig kappa chain V region 3315 [Parambassis ranga]|uniref:Ig kappa chain V region 3315 n=1 Tax=Parambassis ranga TaxID=210632 RepID=A0AC58UVP0_9TELE